MLSAQVIEIARGIVSEKEIMSRATIIVTTRLIIDMIDAIAFANKSPNGIVANATFTGKPGVTKENI